MAQQFSAPVLDGAVDHSGRRAPVGTEDSGARKFAQLRCFDPVRQPLSQSSTGDWVMGGKSPRPQGTPLEVLCLHSAGASCTFAC